MKKLLLGLLFVILILSSCKNLTEEEIAENICNCLNENADMIDSLKLDKCFDQHYHDLSKLSEEEYFEKGNKIEAYLSKSCKEYLESIDFLIEGDWQVIENIKYLQDSNYLGFKDYKGLYYIESNSDTTRVSIQDGIWIEKFDSTLFSTLKIIYTDSTSFYLEFIKSNHPFKKNLSKPGDRYRYYILGKEKYFYKMAVVVQDKIYGFKLYFN